MRSKKYSDINLEVKFSKLGLTIQFYGSTYDKVSKPGIHPRKLHWIFADASEGGC